MQAIMTIGLDLAKSVFQVHGIDAAGNVVVRRQLKRRANPEPSTHVKVFGCWPLTCLATRTGGRRTKTSKGGNRGK